MFWIRNLSIRIWEMDEFYFLFTLLYTIVIAIPWVAFSWWILAGCFIADLVWSAYQNKIDLP